jgi:hypothetical protein
MPLPDDPDAFGSAFRAAVAAVLPSTIVQRVSRTIIAIKLRVDLRRTWSRKSARTGLGANTLGMKPTAADC